MDKKNILVSSCLLGENCKYNGSNNYNKAICDLKEKYNIIPFCPEMLGGLPSPRNPLEFVNGKLIDKDGVSYQEVMDKSSKKILELLEKYDFEFAVLKAKSPSCGNELIYDGTFTHTLVKGDGYACKLIKEKGIKVYSELDEVEY